MNKESLESKRKGGNAVIAIERKGYCTCGRKLSRGRNGLCGECQTVQDGIEMARKSYRE